LRGDLEAVEKEAGTARDRGHPHLGLKTHRGNPPSARHHLRQEPDAGNPPVRICAGGGP
jgi:hypothetical protein